MAELQIENPNETPCPAASRGWGWGCSLTHPTPPLFGLLLLKPPAGGCVTTSTRLCDPNLMAELQLKTLAQHCQQLEAKGGGSLNDRPSPPHFWFLLLKPPAVGCVTTSTRLCDPNLMAWLQVKKHARQQARGLDCPPPPLTPTHLVSATQAASGGLCDNQHTIV
jgi:hypothetical protein